MSVAKLRPALKAAGIAVRPRGVWGRRPPTKPANAVIPNYPALACAARVSGVVRLLGVVGTDGRIRELRVESGHPLLVNAALEAVRQWIYRPTMLNGEAVEVVAPIIVTFTLG